MTQNNKTDVVTNTKCLVHQTKSFWCCNSIYFGIIGSERAKRSHIQWMGSPDSKGEWRQVPPPTTGPSHKLAHWKDALLQVRLRRTFSLSSKKRLQNIPRPSPITLSSMDSPQPFIHSFSTYCMSGTYCVLCGEYEMNLTVTSAQESPGWRVLSWWCQGMQLKGQWSRCPADPGVIEEPQALTTAGTHLGNNERTLNLAFSLVSSQARLEEEGLPRDPILRCAPGQPVISFPPSQPRFLYAHLHGEKTLVSGGPVTHPPSRLPLRPWPRPSLLWGPECPLVTAGVGLHGD